MNTIQKIITTIVLALLFTPTPSIASAQHGQHDRKPKAMTEKEIETIVDDLAEKLALNQVVKGQVLSLFKAHHKEIEEARSQGNKPTHEEMEKRRAVFESKVKALLTEEQRMLFDTFMSKQRPKRQDKPHRR